MAEERKTKENRRWYKGDLGRGIGGRGEGKAREVSGVRQREEANVFISWRGGTLHLPLRSVVMDRVTWGSVRGYLYTQEEREYLYNKKTRGENKSKRQSSGRRRGKERRGRPSFSLEGNVQRWKGWARLRRWEYSRERGDTHTNTHKIIVDVDSTCLVWWSVCTVCVCHMYISALVLYLSVCFLSKVHVCMCTFLSLETALTDKYKLMRCMTPSREYC